jgi:hypothetical protein
VSTAEVPSSKAVSASESGDDAPQPDATPYLRTSRWRGWPWAFLAATTVAGLALRQLIEPVIRWNSPVDDENQMRVAAALLSRQWLGGWGSQPIPHINLSKGPGYPLYLAGVNHLSLSPHIAAYLLYLAGALFLVLGLRGLVGWRVGVVLYALLAFNPHVMSVAFSRPYRDQLVASLALAAFGSAVYLGRTLRARDAWRWPRWVGSVLATVTLASALGWLAITRNDTVWVAVSCALVLLSALVPVARRLCWRGRIRAAVVAVVVAVPVLGLPVAIAALNDHFYGVRLADDYNQGAFKEGVRSWEAVRAPDGDAFMLVNRPQREAAYAVSPAAREVQSALEDPKNPWRGWPCGWRPKEAPPCEEFGPFFGWAIRDAAYQAGYTTPVRFQEYFARLSREIDDACATGQLSCGAKGISADLTPIDAWSARTILSGTVNLANGSFSFADSLEAPQEPVPADQDRVQLWETVMPDVVGLVQLLKAGVNTDTMVQQSTVDLLKRVYAALAVLAVVASVAALVSGLLFCHPVGRIALAAFAGWAANIVIVAIVFAATNRQLVGIVPSYTMPGQAFLIVGLLLSTWVVVKAASRPVMRRWAETRGVNGEGAHHDVDGALVERLHAVGFASRPRQLPTQTQLPNSR